MNFVALWTTTSAPNSSGRWSSGVASVESTTTSAPASCAPSHSTSSSAIATSGFDGVSIHSRSAPAQAREHRGGVGDVDAHDLRLARRLARAQQRPRARVAVVRHDDAGARRQLLEHRRRSRPCRRRTRPRCRPRARRPPPRAPPSPACPRCARSGRRGTSRPGISGGLSGSPSARAPRPACTASVARRSSSLMPRSPARPAARRARPRPRRPPAARSARPRGRSAHSRIAAADSNGASCSSVLIVGNTSRISSRP